MEPNEIRDAVELLVDELLDVAGLGRNDLLVVGCSSSEILGERMGTHSSEVVGQAVFEGLQNVLVARGIDLAAQCCEHLNRALVIERDAVGGADIVNAVPQPKAGGSFATAAYRGFRHPVLVEAVRADAGLDIGGTLIGMHLRPVAVPVRLAAQTLGAARVTAARTRPKFIGGQRAVYDQQLAGGTR